MRILICRLVILATPLAGCAGLGFDKSQDFFVPPGKYEFLRCQDLVQYSQANANRQRELTSLMERASQSSAGPVINATVYEPELHQLQANARQMQQTADEKKCNAGPPPAASGASAAPAASATLAAPAALAAPAR
jgi:hypothetical protein